MKKLSEKQRKMRKRIRDRNYRFRKLTPSKKRVTIAQDVIDQIKAGQLIAQASIYLTSHGPTDAIEEIGLLMEKIEDVESGFSSSSENEEKLKEEADRAAEKIEEIGKAQVCDLLEGAECTVCGIGAAFVAAVKRADDLELKDLLNNTRCSWDLQYHPEEFSDSAAMRRYLRKYFLRRDIALIECAFEQSNGFARHEGVGCNDPEVDRAVSFGVKFSEDEDRLLAIMQNIVDNKGRFRP